MSIASSFIDKPKKKKNKGLMYVDNSRYKPKTKQLFGDFNAGMKQQTDIYRQEKAEKKNKSKSTSVKDLMFPSRNKSKEPFWTVGSINKSYDKIYKEEQSKKNKKKGLMYKKETKEPFWTVKNVTKSYDKIAEQHKKDKNKNIKYLKTKYPDYNVNYQI